MDSRHEAFVAIERRELWYRASLAWQQLLAEPGGTKLVVAHNAVNQVRMCGECLQCFFRVKLCLLRDERFYNLMQALICTALGVGPSHFRRFLQSNGATSVLCFTPDEAGRPLLQVDCLNKVCQKIATPCTCSRVCCRGHDDGTVE